VEGPVGLQVCEVMYGLTTAVRVCQVMYGLTTAVKMCEIYRKVLVNFLNMNFYEKQFYEGPLYVRTDGQTDNRFNFQCSQPNAAETSLKAVYLAWGLHLLADCVCVVCAAGVRKAGCQNVTSW
jgi:hypothetical protein